MQIPRCRGECVEYSIDSLVDYGTLSIFFTPGGNGRVSRTLVPWSVQASIETYLPEGRNEMTGDQTAKLREHLIYLLGGGGAHLSFDKAVTGLPRRLARNAGLGSRPGHRSVHAAAARRGADGPARGAAGRRPQRLSSRPVGHGPTALGRLGRRGVKRNAQPVTWVRAPRPAVAAATFLRSIAFRRILPLKCADDLVVCETGNLTHTVTSISSARGENV